MPRSIQEILDHAEEIARRFEDYQPTEGDERPVEEYLLHRAAMARALSERQIVEAVMAARHAGIDESVLEPGEAPKDRIGDLRGEPGRE